MRQITSHVVNPANDLLKIEVLDEPGHGGACHVYEIAGFDTVTNSGNVALRYQGMVPSVFIPFQNGPIDAEGNGVNGITHEALIAILIDRLQGFQSGRYNCIENANALLHLEAAQKALQSRTLSRMARGVEGTHEV
ncbi:MAG: hypothetical protein AB7G13_28710 [Lautropia sp.]